jgi:hypothetical protein
VTDYGDVGPPVGIAFTENIAWWADNDVHCWDHIFSPTEWHQELGISVQLKFANATDTITLLKAWVQTVPGP